MRDRQDMGYFPIKGMVISSLIGIYIYPLLAPYFVTEDWRSKHFSTLFRWLILAHQIFLPELYLVHPRVFCPKHQNRVGAMKKHRGLCGSAEWPKLPLHLGVLGR